MREAEEAGADHVGGEDLAKRIEEGFDDFDMTIATPDMMSSSAGSGRVLGPSGKMPNPKVGTVTMDIAKAVEESKSGKVEYRTDRTAIVHLVIGKASFDERKLLENYAAVIEELVRAQAVGGAKAATCGRSRSHRRWGRASRSTRAAHVTSSRRRLRLPSPPSVEPQQATRDPRRPAPPILSERSARRAEARDRSPMNRDQKAVGDRRDRRAR